MLNLFHLRLQVSFLNLENNRCFFIELIVTMLADIFSSSFYNEIYL